MWWYCVIRMKNSTFVYSYKTTGFVRTARLYVLLMHDLILLSLQCLSCDFVSLWLANMISIRHIITYDRLSMRLSLARLMAYWHTHSYTPVQKSTCRFDVLRVTKLLSTAEIIASYKPLSLIWGNEEGRMRLYEHRKYQSQVRIWWWNEMIGGFYNVRGLTF